MNAPRLSWVLLTMGDRFPELRAALESVDAQDHDAEVVVVANGGEASVVRSELPETVRLQVMEDNVGVPAGRDAGFATANAPVVGFLDDDAVLLDTDATSRIVELFESDPRIGAVTLRIVDETGRSARRHVPRLGASGSERSGDVVTFLGGASVIRREAYERAGGYWGDLFYAHEELDLAWRLHDLGYAVRYLADVEVEHPAMPIGRHADGWWRTGRNRVMIARRNLPWAVALPHVLIWLVAGWWRAPAGSCRRSYRQGWLAGWTVPVPRRPIRWRTVWRLTKLGRPPIV
ncbi:MAG: glycosyltransferase [Ilumatobacteraceae bacterium]|nr:glycosyltransferase [Ilumatobacteraceae bacterium]